MCTFGDREVFDVDAAVGEARRLGYRRVVTVGWSMGGSAVLRHAALARTGVVVHGRRLRHLPDAVVSVSATSRWFVRDTAPMRRLHWMAETATGRVAARLVMKVRIAPDAWTTVPEPPVELIARIAPTPCLIVHGDRDSYFTLEHPRALAEAAGGAAELWLVPGYGHAEAAATPGLLDRIGRHLEDLLAGRAERSIPAVGVPRQAGPVAPAGVLRRIGGGIGAGGGLSATGRRRRWRG
jgi:pimeloyl-ACP methyl ester carboxylesterase